MQKWFLCVAVASAAGEALGSFGFLNHEIRVDPKSQWMNTLNTGWEAKRETSEREKIPNCLFMDSFCFSIATRSFFKSFLSVSSSSTLFFPTGEETRFPKRLLLEDTMKRSRCHNADNATCQGYLSHLGGKWALLTSRTITRDKIHYHIVKHQTWMNPKKTRVLNTLRSFISCEIHQIHDNMKEYHHWPKRIAWSMVPPSDLPTISISSTWRAIILLDSMSWAV